MITWTGTVYRVKFTHDAGGILEAARHPEGRFHHDGQPALYLSGTAEGAVIATMTYVTPDDPERAIYPLTLTDARLIDLNDAQAVAHHGLDVTHRAARWQEDRAAGMPARTWPLSDAVRVTGADGIIYASRKRPDLSHIVLFRWNDTGHGRLTPGGDPLPFPRL